MYIHIDMHAEMKDCQNMYFFCLHADAATLNPRPLKAFNPEP